MVITKTRVPIDVTPPKPYDAWCRRSPRAALRSSRCVERGNLLPFSLSLHDSERIRLVTHSRHRGDDAARAKVDHVEVTKLLRERRRRGSAADHRIAAVGRD